MITLIAGTILGALSFNKSELRVLKKYARRIALDECAMPFSRGSVTWMGRFHDARSVVHLRS
ncbi:hypothetical protein [Solilutibacter silvestris]|uniref:hypothetical protein n=1 Tax=Solilutibacter silvestris TaxID=1645665 RepID=UPI003D34C0F7